MTKIQKKNIIKNSKKKKTQFKLTQIKMKNLWLGCYTKVIAFESKLNKSWSLIIEQFNVEECKLKQKTVKKYESTQVNLQTATMGIWSG
jgi:hypothetical protein